MFVIRVGLGFKCCIKDFVIQLWFVCILDNTPIEGSTKFQLLKVFFSCSPSYVVCSSNDVSNDDFFTFAFVNVPLGEQLLQVANIVHKGRGPSHFSGILKASSPSIFSVNSIPIVISFIFFLPKKSKGVGTQLSVP